MKTTHTLITLMAALSAAVSCTSNTGSGTQHQHWVCPHGDHAGAEIVFARMGNVFRGEYIDPGFQDFTSIPIVGTIDSKGNVTGVSGVIPHYGNIVGKLTGRITGNRFTATWSPAPKVIEYYMSRDMEMELQKPTPQMEEEMGKHPGAFYNPLFPDQTMVINGGPKISRITPFVPAVVSDGTYGYAMDGWETRTIHIAPGNKKGEVDFRLYVKTEGQNGETVNIMGSAPLNGNTFHYRYEGGEFEVSVYTDFVAVKTTKGNTGADGVYPASIEQPFYISDDFDQEAPDDPMVERISNDLIGLPEMKFDHAAILFVSGPSDEEPYYTFQGGSNMQTHFATSYWFHVYTAPKYEIKVYDLIMDEELSLGEWREASVREVLAYLKLDNNQSGAQLRLLYDEVLWISGDDTETLRKYGFDPEEVADDYQLYNEDEFWLLAVTTPETTFKIHQYNEGYINVNQAAFKKRLMQGDDTSILAKITISNGVVISVDEVYIP